MPRPVLQRPLRAGKRGRPGPPGSRVIPASFMPVQHGGFPPPLLDRRPPALPVENLWLLWEARVVFAYLRETAERLRLPRPVLDEALARVGLVWAKARWRIPCPHCAFPQRWIRWMGDRWACINCGLGRLRRPCEGGTRSNPVRRFGARILDGARRPRQRLIYRLSQYQCLLLVGTRNLQIVRDYRDRLLRALRWALRPYSQHPAISPLMMLEFCGVATAFLEEQTAWRTRLTVPAVSGPIWQAVTPHLLQAAAETWLRPDAYRDWYIRLLNDRLRRAA